MRLKAISLFALIMTLCFSCGTGSGTDSGEETGIFDADADYIQVVLFHMAQRCESCEAVEHETRLLLEEEYKEEVADGKVVFVPLNYQSRNGKSTAELLQAAGQTLFVVKGDSIEDLTVPAFMFAHTHPERYLSALREALDKYLE